MGTGFDVGPWNLPNLVPSGQGWMSDVECAVICGFAKIAEFNSALEIGCYKGRLTSALVKVFGRVTVIDTFTGPQECPPEEGLRAKFEANVVPDWPFELEILEGRSEDKLKELTQAHAQFDVIIIDGDHRTEAVTQDLTLSWPLLKEGGYLFIDDCNWSTVYKGVVKWVRDGDWKDATAHRVTDKMFYARKVDGKLV